MGDQPEAQTRSVGAGRLVSIDALRGVAAMAVVGFHALRFHGYVGAPNLLGRAIAFVLSLGFTGVYLFFVISGFCIHLRWASARAGGGEPRIGFIGFWKRRVRRLYPAYLVAFVIYLAVEWRLGLLHPLAPLWLDVGLHLLLLHNLLATTIFSLNGVFWTLAVEEQLYALYFVLLRLRARLGWPRLLALTLATRAGWFALGMLLHRRFGVSIIVGEATASAWFAWTLGALAVEASVGLCTLPGWCTRGWAAAALLAASVACSWAVTAVSPSSLAHHLLWLLEQPIWALGYFVLVGWMVAREERCARNAFVVGWSRLGLFSYSIYLTHEIVLTELVGWLAARYHWSPDRVTLLSLLVFAPLAVLVARLFFVLFERPFMSRAAPMRALVAAPRARAAQ